MKIIKRNGSEEDFNVVKIINAVKKANNSNDTPFLTDEQINDIADYVEYKCNKIKRAVSVEEIQDMVEDQLMAKGAFELARRYVRYRYNRSLIRKANTTDNRILSLIECNNEEVKQENSNKNPTVNSVQRDYMAGEVSRDLTRRMLLPPDIVEADKQGIIHFHDSDYFAQHMHNCDLVNLEDMLQNGTVISDTLIEKPHSFSTACNIATQIIAQVASNQYGGQSISLTHLAPFVQISREKIRKETIAEFEEIGIQATEEKINEVVERRLRLEVNRGVQTIQYQVVTLLTTNGQAPFVTVYMYLNEAKDEQEKADLARKTDGRNTDLISGSSYQTYTAHILRRAAVSQSCSPPSKASACRKHAYRPDRRQHWPRRRPFVGSSHRQVSPSRMARQRRRKYNKAGDWSSPSRGQVKHTC